MCTSDFSFIPQGNEKKKINNRFLNVCRNKSLTGVMLPNIGPKNKVSMSMFLSTCTPMHVFCKETLVLDTLFQESL